MVGIPSADAIATFRPSRTGREVRFHRPRSSVYAAPMQSKATTVAQYLKELPEDRRAAIEAVRGVILKNLDKDYAEGMSYGMIGYYVPHSVYPPGYHCDPKLPLPFAGLASQKNAMSVYILTVYSDESDPHSHWFREAWRATGKKLDMGKCCIRFKRVDDLALDVIGEAIRRFPVKKFIEHYESAILTANKNAAAKRGKGAAPASKAKPTAKKGTAKRAVSKKTGKKAGPRRAVKKAAAPRSGRAARKAATRGRAR